MLLDLEISDAHVKIFVDLQARIVDFLQREILLRQILQSKISSVFLIASFSLKVSIFDGRHVRG